VDFGDQSNELARQAGDGWASKNEREMLGD
jgi:hypothetical protein